ncbi:site-specific integrase [Haloferax volcanii]|uniref:XerC/D-like integrase n=3 Tax=Haloferax volcanii TaxID=2246 RepID=A0A384KVG8_HALVD|nr:site-specific integrase [Haloferax volcanii]ADE01846.1 integrase family protein [Haloferax volcanii DS2]ELY37418.1 XerC/D-like integrase [Haloferax volcanii DS2]MBS8120488.1 tyrosine-type recombinase/integrase [Haloferax volcanii]MBS8125525.1 tyrosine-type recombinase/integrase [Haloferax volcanii]MBS8129392.1 tyrosine-type recombinase/integrase [Haloferax volcanii]
MARKYDQQYEDARERIRNHSTEGTHQVRKGVERTHPGYEDAEDAERILTMADAYDADNLVVDCPEGQSTKSVTTLKNYLTGLNKIAPHVALTDTTATELNTVMQGFLDGDLHNVKDSGLSKGSIRVYQNALRQFYYVHDDVGVDPEDITLFKTDDKAVDPADMLTREEIQAIRDAADCMRDRALFDFLIYTGQRNTATRSLRIKDLDLENDRFRLNTDADGLKGAETNGKWRDLLLSSATVKQYLNTEHPAPDDPEAYVFTSRPKYGGPKPREMLDVTTLGGIVGRLADRAAEDYPAIASKPTYPHALRHNFVTIALRRGMDETAIKHQIGHAPNSSVMESTYAHLKDSDHIRAARDAFDLETEDHESELTPEVCPRCGESPPEDARLCPYCGLAFTPDAEQAVEDAEEAVNDSYRQTPPEDAETKEKIDLVYDLLDDPDVKAAIAEQKAEE